MLTGYQDPVTDLIPVPCCLRLLCLTYVSFLHSRATVHCARDSSSSSKFKKMLLRGFPRET